MLYRELGETGLKPSVLGLGCMRMPILEGDSSKIDEKAAISMIRKAIDEGITYIDTAYPYHGANSELLVGKALLDGYREKVTLVTKAPTWMLKEESDFEKYLDEQLEKLQVECIDIYLLHALDKGRWANMESLNVTKYAEKAIEEGKIKHLGFSFHDDLPTFKKIVDGYDKWSMLMLQFNFMDINEQAGIEGVKYAAENNIPVVVMEPLKGGLLANAPDYVQEIWNKSDEKKSPVEWALRFVADMPEVKVVLSGMSNEEQLMENIGYADSFVENSLTGKDKKLIEAARESYEDKVKVKCTDCKYCMPCPKGVNIPGNLGLYNRASIFENIENPKGIYNGFYSKEQRASNCVKCGICEPQCPQKIDIMDQLENVADLFEK